MVGGVTIIGDNARRSSPRWCALFAGVRLAKTLRLQSDIGADLLELNFGVRIWSMAFELVFVFVLQHATYY